MTIQDLSIKQETLLMGTYTKVVYALATYGPLTVWGIHKATHCHRNHVLPKALWILEGGGVVIKRKPKAFVFPKHNDNSDQLLLGKYRHNQYYILNLNHRDSIMFFTEYLKRNLGQALQYFENELNSINNNEPLSEIEQEIETIINATKEIVKEEGMFFEHKEWALDFLIYLKLKYGTLPQKGKYSYTSLWATLESWGALEYPLYCGVTY